jgi:hypothetical protein
MTANTCFPKPTKPEPPEADYYTEGEGPPKFWGKFKMWRELRKGRPEAIRESIRRKEEN